MYVREGDAPARVFTDWGWWQCYRTRGLCWFRLFGRGLLMKDTRLRPLIPSERFWPHRHLRAGPYLVRYLPRERETTTA